MHSSHEVRYGLRGNYRLLERLQDTLVELRSDVYYRRTPEERCSYSSIKYVRALSV